MTPDDPQAAAISELANALQVSVPAAARLRQRLDEQTQDADTLEASLARAMTAIRQLQSGRGEER
jgi:hypothetical protein